MDNNSSSRPQSGNMKNLPRKIIPFLMTRISIVKRFADSGNVKKRKSKVHCASGTGVMDTQGSIAICIEANAISTRASRCRDMQHSHAAIFVVALTHATGRKTTRHGRLLPFSRVLRASAFRDFTRVCVETCSAAGAIFGFCNQKSQKTFHLLSIANRWNNICIERYSQRFRSNPRF